jgi:hypothetical protein
MLIEKPEITELRERLHGTLDNLRARVNELPEGGPKVSLLRELAALSRILKEWSQANSRE